MGTYTSSFLHGLIFWTRASVLFISIFVILITLGLYSSVSIPIFSILGNENTFMYGTLENSHQVWAVEMVQDRRVIATLVATQASIFCPLFLLLGHHFQPAPRASHREPGSKSITGTGAGAGGDVWRASAELICQLLMPLGLSMSWMFCILFDRKTSFALSGSLDEYWFWPDLCVSRPAGLLSYSPSSSSSSLSPSSLLSSSLSLSPSSVALWGWSTCATTHATHALKYCIIAILLTEVALVLFATFSFGFTTMCGYQESEEPAAEKKSDVVGYCANSA
ncbi:hypothetical protein PHYBLDRAFT_61037 [Phycomyces blakesleeanus NRRL 1555(-)]|uniref:Transmembrane protein n=1 Tax=Phycomyces blakesleeanus (strain ATCC 8743b / DSM 1359 / FGSC 10004 / NBRC 33097 / NRRL 1555) TaxID=763407 RepID=A0A162NJY9_PHYB8|nr:hypothetical protein PHYBLDRAFT_61037 [Phycomyces blakesleeanus NRRL 1555(-)]OAD74918.1 hypothetical protein PHYBLDRAFT_61037 [Phycomyces blakesleeanus NRRL 1555(-)]|eukprot:XP_018292958.1 hypothetical protein PHYBLDRAFT_61037 [Phycomyces blakesleeanus NRRL 1555(-)]